MSGLQHASCSTTESWWTPFRISQDSQWWLSQRSHLSWAKNRSFERNRFNSHFQPLEVKLKFIYAIHWFLSLTAVSVNSSKTLLPTTKIRDDENLQGACWLCRQFYLLKKAPKMQLKNNMWASFAYKCRERTRLLAKDFHYLRIISWKHFPQSSS